jgi:hypothetical protein
LTQTSAFGHELPSVAETTAITKPVVVSGLGYPNGREETSPSPLGWQAQTTEATTIEKQVSRETSG